MWYWSDFLLRPWQQYTAEFSLSHKCFSCFETVFYFSNLAALLGFKNITKLLDAVYFDEVLHNKYSHNRRMDTDWVTLSFADCRFLEICLKSWVRTSLLSSKHIWTLVESEYIYVHKCTKQKTDSREIFHFKYSVATLSKEIWHFCSVLLI